MTASEPQHEAQQPLTRIVVAADGYQLSASHFEATDADTVVLVNSATAVPRRFYQRFATNMQRQGWQALTYDYRGIGDSKPASLRGFDADMRDWVLLDMTTMIDWIDRTLAPKRLFVIGHSFGGQALGMLENAGRVDAMVGVSAQSGYWGTRRAVDDMMRAYPNVTRRHIRG